MSDSLSCGTTRIMWDTQSAKPQSFKTGDGWFVFNMAANLAACKQKTDREPRTWEENSHRVRHPTLEAAATHRGTISPGEVPTRTLQIASPAQSRDQVYRQRITTGAGSGSGCTRAETPGPGLAAPSARARGSVDGMSLALSPNLWVKPGRTWTTMAAARERNNEASKIASHTTWYEWYDILVGEHPDTGG